MEQRQKRSGGILNRIIRNIAGIVMITLVITAIAIAAYALFDLHDMGTRALPANYEIYKPGEQKLSFEELIQINPEVIGWIDIYGTNIDYPVVQGPDNDKYLMTAADLQYSVSGAVFLDYRNSPDFTDFNNIIHGHSMAYNAMFGDVSDFAEDSFFEEHRFGDLFFGDRHHGLRIVGFVEVDAYRSGLYSVLIESEKQKEDFLAELDEAGKYPFVAPDRSTDNTYVLLSTCTSGFTNGRHILVCMLTDEVYEDPFAGETTSGRDTVGGPRLRLRFFIIVMCIILALIMTVIVLRRAENRQIKAGKR